ncbi:type 4a pilus biogenesis protein PilO [Halomonas aquamarina]|uniref:Type 4a pilus biogenesis protein PilO n=1 Tax=Vreelandella aquamarina TaxID=77097 RepID=A0ACC5VSS7_9GAMM|nr:type 4a pilus biogenesis protein PilO [Halomonas aquamarina]MBZ5487192.1 type 4a pilus biogenesis protein PilO [Halomonas aquamarina]
MRPQWQKEWQRLQALDWRELDLGEAGNWPWSIKVLGGVLVFIVALALVGGWWANDDRSALKGAQREEARLLNDYRSSVHAAGLLGQARAHRAALDAQMTQVRGLLTPLAGMPALVESLVHAAEANHLAVDALHQPPSVSHAFHTEYPLKIEVLGGYHDIAEFVADISRLPQLLSLHAFTLEPSASPGASLRLTLTARAYDVKEPGEHDDLSPAAVSP